MRSRHDTLTRHFHSQFMHEFHALRRKDAHYRIFLAIENTAKKTGHTFDAVAKVLVENGLRADREAFTGEFIDTLKGSGKQKRGLPPVWAINSMTTAQRELVAFWEKMPTRLPAAPSPIIPRYRL